METIYILFIWIFINGNYFTFDNFISNFNNLDLRSSLQVNILLQKIILNYYFKFLKEDNIIGGGKAFLFLEVAQYISYYILFIISLL